VKVNSKFVALTPTVLVAAALRVVVMALSLCSSRGSSQRHLVEVVIGDRSLHKDERSATTKRRETLFQQLDQGCVWRRVDVGRVLLEPDTAVRAAMNLGTARHLAPVVVIVS
jgi:hypothetical protein